MNMKKLNTGEKTKDKNFKIILIKILFKKITLFKVIFESIP